METIIKIIPKQNIYIIDEDYYYALTVKYSLNKKFGEEVAVHVFRNVESLIKELKKTDNKPEIVLMDHEQNKEIIIEGGKYTIEAVKEISPATTIIILSDEKDQEKAAKTLGHGAQNFVVKDQFSFEHICSTVERCLHPVKV